jgi:hypothetical protein
MIHNHYVIWAFVLLVVALTATYFVLFPFARRGAYFTTFEILFLKSIIPTKNRSPWLGRRRLHFHSDHLEIGLVV